MKLAPYEDPLAPYQDKLAPYGERGMALIEDADTGCFSNCQIREKILIKYGKRTPENNAERMAILILVGSHHLRRVTQFLSHGEVRHQDSDRL